MKTKNIFNLPIFKSKKILITLAIILGLCIVLIFFSDTSNLKNEEEEQNLNFVEDEYILQTETKLKNLLLKLSYIKDVDVLIYTKSSTEILYAYNIEEERDKDNIIRSEQVLCFSEDGKTSNAIIVTKKYPPIEGVLISVNGKIDEKCRINIINAVSAVLDVDIQSIEVLTG